MLKQRWWQWSLAILMTTALVAIPFAYYRWQYNRMKRLRVVVDGKVYRSGQMTADGLDEAVRRFGFRTIINFQDELPDPELAPDLLESEYCEQRGIRYEFIPPDLIDHWMADNWRPRAATRFPVRPRSHSRRMQDAFPSLKQATRARLSPHGTRTSRGLRGRAASRPSRGRGSPPTSRTAGPSDAGRPVRGRRVPR